MINCEFLSLQYLPLGQHTAAHDRSDAICHSGIMSKTITLSPVTRIEGHLGIKVEVEDGKVARAQVSGEMFRGFENLLRGRDPLDAQYITQRICGVCPLDHGIASVLAQDMAYQLTPPDNGRIVRNLMQAANFIASHITHFYLLSALDFVDVAMITEYQGKDHALLDLQAWVKSQLASRQVYPAAPFLPRFNTKYLADKDANFGALKHYLDALDIRAQAQKMAALFAGKVPHAASLVPGGVTVKVTSLNLSQYGTLLEQVRDFIDQAYLPDVLAVAAAFPEYFSLGRGCGNFLSYGAFPESRGGWLEISRRRGADQRPVAAGGSRRRHRRSRPVAFFLRHGPQAIRRGDGCRAGKERRLFMAQSAPLSRRTDGGGAARPHARGLPGWAQRGVKNRRGRPAQDPWPPGHGFTLGHGTARGARSGMQDGGRPVRSVAESAQARRPEFQRFFHSGRRARLRVDRSSAGRAGTLAGNQGPENQQLPVRGADDLELFAAR